MRRFLMLVLIVILFVGLMFAVPVLAQDGAPAYEPLADLALDVGGIALVVGILFYLLRKSLPETPRDWLFEQNEWLVNLGVVLLSVGVANVGAWLNLMAFQPRTVTEYIWKGLFSAAAATFGYEFTKNLGRKVPQRGEA